MPSGVGVNAEVEVADTAVLLALSGPNNELLKVLGEETGVGVGLRGNSILLAGEPDRVALAELVRMLRPRGAIVPGQLFIFGFVLSSMSFCERSISPNVEAVSARGKPACWRKIEWSSDK